MLFFFALIKNLPGLFLEFAKFLFGAADGHLQGVVVIQGEHAHKAFAVDLLLVVAYQHLKGLYHSQRHEVLHLAECTHDNIKLPHARTSLLYKSDFVRYNKRARPIIAELFYFSIRKADDLYKK